MKVAIKGYRAEPCCAHAYHFIIMKQSYRNFKQWKFFEAAFCWSTFLETTVKGPENVLSLIQEKPTLSLAFSMELQGIIYMLVVFEGQY